MKKRLLPCLAVLFLLLTDCGVGHMGVHALEDITDADTVAHNMGYSAVQWTTPLINICKLSMNRKAT